MPVIYRSLQYSSSELLIKLQLAHMSSSGSDTETVREYNVSNDHLYVMIRSDAPSSLIKVGRSKDPQKRARDLESSQCFRMEVAIVFPNQGRHENKVLKTLRNKRTRGGRGQEWFNLPVRDAVPVITDILWPRTSITDDLDKSNSGSDIIDFDTRYDGTSYSDMLPIDFDPTPDLETKRKLEFCVKCLKEAPTGAKKFNQYLKSKNAHLKVLAGKHAGKLFRNVLRDDHDYCQFMLNNTSVIYSLFVTYLATTKFVKNT